MRLMDQVAQATEPVLIERPSGLVALPGAASRAADVRAAPLRYVLDELASRQCWDFICANEWVLDPDDPSLRIPCRRLWLEWFAQNTARREHGPQRVGFLVEAEDRGRRGWLQSFWEEPGREPEMCQARILFDLDDPVPPPIKDGGGFKLRCREQGAVAKLVDHMAVSVAPEWVEALNWRGPCAYQAAVARIIDSIWADLAVVLGFQRLLLARSEVAESRIDRAALNASRARQGKPALLDHVEVTLRLGAGAMGGRAGQSGGRRSSSRLHLVRGHFVRRNGKLFWRRAHERGQPAAAPLTRTVRVTARS